MCCTRSHDEKRKLQGFIPDVYLSSSSILSHSLKNFLDKNIQIDGLVSSPHHLVYPAVFNFKNGAELWLKYLQNTICGKSNESSHDLFALLDELVKKISDGSHKNRDKILVELEAVKKLLTPYYTGEYLGAAGSFPDKKNEAERYPEAKNQGVYRPVNFLIFRVEDNLNVTHIVVSLLEAIEKFRSTVRQVHYYWED